MPAGAWIRCHNLDRLLAPYWNRSPSLMWPSQDSPPHAASLHADESSPASPPAREGPGRWFAMDKLQVASCKYCTRVPVALESFRSPSVWTWTRYRHHGSPIAESHCLIDPSATLLDFAILASRRVLRKAKGKQEFICL